MSEKVMIASIVGAVVIIVLLMFRRQLKHFLFKAGKDGLEAQLDTHDQPTGGGSGAAGASGVHIDDNSQLGSDNLIDVGREDASINRNKLWGKGNKIVVRSNELSDKRSDKPSKK